jgi:hypothetical protein
MPVAKAEWVFAFPVGGIYPLFVASLCVRLPTWWWL